MPYSQYWLIQYQDIKLRSIFYSLVRTVVDAVDTVVDSGLLIDNVELTSVPEPGLIFGLSLIGALGATSLKGKQKKEM
ncbi:MAG: PEP-CTERM sorting domain-containing protein [Okeania sp. SIO3C4]|nr:PEP-CTERM sorting domain-containing protein [Okeania sp. SIO3C4]